MSANNVTKTSGDATGSVAWRVGRGTACLLLAVWCFTRMVALRNWHGTYAPSTQWAEKIRKESTDPDWSSVVAQAARNIGTAKMSKEKLADVTFEAAKKVGSPYAKALDRRREINAAFQSRLAAVDAEVEAKTTLRERISKETNEERRKELKEELATLSKDLVALNAQRAGFELYLQKQLDATEKEIKKSETEIRAVIEQAAGYARPVERLPWYVPKERALDIGDETSGWHLVYIVTWYLLELIIVGLVCLAIVPILVSRAGKPKEETETVVRDTVTDKLRGVLGPRAVSAAGKVVAALAVTAVAAGGLAAGAGDNPPVNPALLLHDGGEVAAAPKGDRGEKGAAGETAPIPPEIAAQLKAQAEALKTQGELIADVSERLSKVAASAATTAETTSGLLDESRKMTDNMTRMATNAATAATTLGSVNDGVARVADAHYWSMLGAAANAKFVEDSLAKLQVTNVVTANGVAGVQNQVGQSAAAAAETQAVAIRVSAMRDGFLRPLNPFAKYKVKPRTLDAARHAMNMSTPKAKLVEQGLLFMEKQGPVGYRAFQRQLRNNTDEDAHELLADLMPLILKTSHGGSDE